MSLKLRLPQIFSLVNKILITVNNLLGWYLYTTIDKSKCIETADQTFEVLMSDLDQEAMEAFYSKNCATGLIASKKSGIIDIVKCEQIDAYQFEPCGYSANAIIEGDYYWNIHITPEKDFSYASFETNYPQGKFNPRAPRGVNLRVTLVHQL